MRYIDPELGEVDTEAGLNADQESLVDAELDRMYGSIDDVIDQHHAELAKMGYEYIAELRSAFERGDVSRISALSKKLKNKVLADAVTSLVPFV